MVSNLPLGEYSQEAPASLKAAGVCHKLYCFNIGSTSVGVHKDDIEFLINSVDAKIYGSQGQQKTAALSVKLAEIELMKLQTGSKPVLLLDDVLSELDESRRNYFLKNMAGVQTLITCTDITELISEGKIYKVSHGRITD